MTDEMKPIEIRIATKTFEKTRADMMDLTVGDNIEVYSHADKGWSKGKNMRTGVAGWFPTAMSKVIDASSIGAERDSHLERVDNKGLQEIEQVGKTGYKPEIEKRTDLQMQLEKCKEEEAKLRAEYVQARQSVEVHVNFVVLDAGRQAEQRNNELLNDVLALEAEVEEIHATICEKSAILEATRMKIAELASKPTFVATPEYDEIGELNEQIALFEELLARVAVGKDYKNELAELRLEKKQIEEEIAGYHFSRQKTCLEQHGVVRRQRDKPFLWDALHKQWLAEEYLNMQCE